MEVRFIVKTFKLWSMVFGLLLLYAFFFVIVFFFFLFFFFFFFSSFFIVVAFFLVIRYSQNSLCIMTDCGRITKAMSIGYLMTS
jgi:hypothetical protein